MAWLAIPIERFIGGLKGTVSLMSNIDADLTNKSIALGLPPKKVLLEPPWLPGPNEPFPRHLTRVLLYARS